MVLAAVLGATAWVLFDAATQADGNDVALATLAAAFLVGAVGRLLARWQQAPAALFVVPAILPLLPGLLVVQAMLATVDAVRVGGLIDATATAFLVGVGVASGDIAVVVVRRIRERIVAPAVDAVAGGVDILVVRPVGRALGGATEATGDGLEASRRRGRRRRIITPRPQGTGGRDVGGG
jgi:uncharacterized membrane protein YjjB (DUF3815 family)